MMRSSLPFLLVLALAGCPPRNYVTFRDSEIVPAATVDGTAEFCDSSAETAGTIPAGYRRMPESIANCTARRPENLLDVSFLELVGPGPINTCWQLQPRFRTAAQALAALEPAVRDSAHRLDEIQDGMIDHLEEAAVLYYWNSGDNFPQAPINGLTPAHASAMADLAVTGRVAYEAFLYTQPHEAGPGIPGSRTVQRDRVRDRILAQAPAHATDDAEIDAAITAALDRAYTVLWAIRGPVAERARLRSDLGYIAISADDDPPHRPLNVPSPDVSPPPPPGDLPALTVYQQETPVTVPMRRVDWSRPREPVTTTSLQVQMRYLVIVDSDDAVGPAAPPTFEHRSLPPPIDTVTLTPEHDVILFLHGHGSRAEEALALARPLIAAWSASGRDLAVIAMDLPGFGYSTKVDHRAIADVTSAGATRQSQFEWGDTYIMYTPTLDFLEASVIAFVEQIGRLRFPSLARQIKAVVGGSLGGNLGLRLSRLSKTTYPWLEHIVAFSPASTWGDSWSRARPCGPDLISCTSAWESGTYVDTAKWAAIDGTRGRYLDEHETPESKLAYFVAAYTASSTLIESVTSSSFPPQRERWYRADWPCRLTSMKASIFDRWEIYEASYRTWHWRVAHEQLMFMHNEPIPRVTARGSSPGDRSYQRFTSHVLLAAGTEDNSAPERLFDHTRALAVSARDYHRDRERPRLTGRTLWLAHTGHSIQSERPRYFAGVIAGFLAYELER